jgi:hypothetical protein
MAHPQVLDGGTASNMEGSCKSSPGQPTRHIPPTWWLGEGLTTPHCKNESLLQNIHRQSLGHGLRLLYDLSNERGTRDLVPGMLGACIGLVHLQQKPRN